MRLTPLDVERGRLFNPVEIALHHFPPLPEHSPITYEEKVLISSTHQDCVWFMTIRLVFSKLEVINYFPGIRIPAGTHYLDRLYVTDVPNKEWCFKIMFYFETYLVMSGSSSFPGCPHLPSDLVVLLAEMVHLAPRWLTSPFFLRTLRLLLRETPSPLRLLHLWCILHVAFSYFYSEIIGHAFHTWLRDDFAVIFSHGSLFSIYKRPRSPFTIRR
ncbi:hypothetical protein Acr_28g0008020 [Actinidia rufa]|uniref:Uncharacterized protein n=1 Tax=Actinidia rufa TaxID=165716 RepID=A0A7J0HAG4_9ERIC|nr:hypothetical protein Acr_28g0008020 [Actinidia rufa]